MENQREIMEICHGKGECYKGCGKVLLLSSDDIFISTVKLQDEQKKLSFTFRCPHCGVFSTIPSWHLPKMVIKAVWEKYNSLS